MLIEFEEIRECFRILAQCKNKEVLKESICEIEKELDYSVMNNNALYQKKLDYKQAIDLFLLKKHLYNLYFFYKKIQRLVGL